MTPAYDFRPAAKALVQLLERSVRAGWSPEDAAKLYLEHAFSRGYVSALRDAFGTVRVPESEGRES